MSNILGTVRKAGNAQKRSVADAQYATQLALCDALNALSWSKAKTARALCVSLNTVRSWCDGRTTPDICVIIACPELMRAWQAAFDVRHSEVLAKRAA